MTIFVSNYFNNADLPYARLVLGEFLLFQAEIIASF
jgi:hypothetical protein